MERDGVVLESVGVRLVCAVGGVRLRVPCRGDRCRHVDCFDRAVFFSLNEQRLNAALRKQEVASAADFKPSCPLCDAAVKTLRVDEVVLRLLAAAPEEADIVTVGRDMSWVPVVDDPEEGAAASAAAGSSGGKQVEVIELSDSDDEDGGGGEAGGAAGEGGQPAKQASEPATTTAAPRSRPLPQALSKLPAVPTDGAKFGKRRIGANLLIRLPKVHPNNPSSVGSGASAFAPPQQLVRPVACLPSPHTARLARDAALGAALMQAQRSQALLVAASELEAVDGAITVAQSSALPGRTTVVDHADPFGVSYDADDLVLSRDAARLLEELSGIRQPLTQQRLSGPPDVITLSDTDEEDGGRGGSEAPAAAAVSLPPNKRSRATFEDGYRGGGDAGNAGGGSLTSEQMERIERNRQEALKRRAIAQLNAAQQSQYQPAGPPAARAVGSAAVGSAGGGTHPSYAAHCDSLMRGGPGVQGGLFGAAAAAPDPRYALPTGGPGPGPGPTGAGRWAYGAPPLPLRHRPSPMGALPRPPGRPPAQMYAGGLGGGPPPPGSLGGGAPPLPPGAPPLPPGAPHWWTQYP